MSDWLDIGENIPALPIPVELPIDPHARLALAQQCWAQLTDKQRTFLTAFRENRLNARRTSHVLHGNESGRQAHKGWMHQPNYLTIVRLWRGVTGSEALDKDRLLTRQDDIVETLLTPKPILYQGEPTGYEEIEASAAARANETLMKAAGLLKDKDIEINVGLVGPSLNIQVVQADDTIRHVSNEGVSVELPEPIDAEWLEVPADGT